MRYTISSAPDPADRALFRQMQQQIQSLNDEVSRLHTELKSRTAHTAQDGKESSGSPAAVQAERPNVPEALSLQQQHQLKLPAQNGSHMWPQQPQMPHRSFETSIFAGVHSSDGFSRDLPGMSMSELPQTTHSSTATATENAPLVDHSHRSQSPEQTEHPTCRAEHVT